MILKILRKNLIIVLCFLVFLLGFGLRLHALDLKADLHLDEALSIILSNYSNFGFTEITEDNKYYTGLELKQKTYWNDGSIKDTLSDISHLYLYTRDDPHTNFYYILFRLAFVGVDNFDIEQTIFRGGVLNLAFYSLSFFIMFKLLNLFVKRELIPFGLFCAFVTPAVISSVALFRPYQLQEVLFISFTYVFAKFYLDLKQGKFDLSNKNLLFISFVTALTLLTGYFVSIYVTMCVLVLIFEAFKLKNPELNKFLWKIFGISLLFVNLMYPSYIIGFFSYRTQDSLNEVANFIPNFLYSFRSYILGFLTGIFSLSLIFYLGFLFFKSKPKKNDCLKNIFIIGFLWCFIAMFISPIKSIRYIIPVFAVLSMIIPYIVEFQKNRVLPVCISLIILSLNVYLAFSFVKNDNIGRYVPFISKMNFIKNKKVNKFLFLEDVNKPVYIVKQEENLTQGEILLISQLLPYFDNQQKYAYINVEDKNLIKDKSFYVLFPKSSYENFALVFNNSFKRTKIQDCSTDYSCVEFTY